MNWSWKRSVRIFAIALAVAPVGVGPAAAEAPPVFVTIKPIHSLVASVMRDVGTPYLLLKGGASPHAYALRPSEARQLARARLVFWVGDGLETFLEKPLESLAGKATVIALHDVAGVRLLKIREGGAWEVHKHADEKDRDHKAHKHDHGHDKKGERRDEHAHGEQDMHVWLDPHNAEAMVSAIAAALAKADPANAAAYRRNAAATVERIEALEKELDRTLAPVRARRFIVFHDAYQYFERRYRLAAAGSITLNPQQAPGAQRMASIRARLKAAKVRCVFMEPQFEPKLVDTAISGTGVRKATLDPLGADIPEGPDAYFATMRRLGAALRACLE